MHYNLSVLKNLGFPTEFYDDLLIKRIVLLLDLKTQRDWELRIAVLTEVPQYSDLGEFWLEPIRVLEYIESAPVSCLHQQKFGSLHGSMVKRVSQQMHWSCPA